MCMCSVALSRVQLFATLWTGALQVPLSMDSPGKNTGVGSHFLLQGIFPTRGLYLCLLLGGRILYHWATGETPAVAFNIIIGARSQTQSQERSGKRIGLTYALIEGFWHAEARGGLIVSRTSYVIAPCHIFDFLFLFLNQKWEQKLGNLAVTDQVLTLVSWLLWRLWVRKLFFHIWSGHLSVFQGSNQNILGEPF